MTAASPVLAVAVALGLVTSSVSLATSPATGALLIEGHLVGEDLRIVVDAATNQAEVTLGATRHRIDLAAETAERIDGDGRKSEVQVSARARAPKPDIEPWGSGPKIAGHPSVYHVISVNDQICGEVLISPWMKPFVDPAIRAMAILERVKGEGGIQPIDLDGACGKLPFSSYAMLGWPLMAGSIDAPIFETEAIDFAYSPGAGELAWNQ